MVVFANSAWWLMGIALPRRGLGEPTRVDAVPQLPQKGRRASGPDRRRPTIPLDRVPPGRAVEGRPWLGSWGFFQRLGRASPAARCSHLVRHVIADSMRTRNLRESVSGRRFPCSLASGASFPGSYLPEREEDSMSGRQMEGNEEQRRKAARMARDRGREPSAEGKTQGASKQREHVRNKQDHREKIETIREGKQPV